MVLTIRVSRLWIVKHKWDEEAPLDRLAVALKDGLPDSAFGNWDIRLHVLDVGVGIDWAQSDWEQRVKVKMQELFEDWEESGIEVTLGDENDDEEDDTPFAKTKTAEPSAAETPIQPAGTGQTLAPNKPLMAQELQSTKKEDKWSLNEEKVKGRLQTIDGLMGADEFKELAKELVAIAPQIVENKTFEIFSYQSYLFSINNGFGLTTYLKAFAELLNEIHIQAVRTDEIKEIVLDAPKGETDDPFGAAMVALRVKTSRALDVLCIDISEWMGKLDSRPFRKFLEFVESRVSDHVVVFRVPFVDREVLERIRSSLNDIMYVRPVAFPPLAVEELVAWGVQELDKYGFQLSKEARPYLQERLMLERSDGKFYGLNTVRKVVRELLYKKQLRNARKKRANKTISAADAKLICGELDKKLTGEQMLAEMVGGEKMKEQIASIISQIEMSREEGANAPCIHMRFSGSPGTGKTTVARIIGKILKEKGLLRIGNFYEYAGRDFCGRYIGETAPKTASMCRDAYGSVLFIDEAYSLYRGDGNERDYGREAIDTLIAEMENHRHDLVVIMAGYKDEMETLMKGNSGLASRMPYMIEFPNFTREELYQIFESMSKKKWQCEDGYLQEAKTYFDNLPDSVLNSKEFSNARFVRNLYERAWAKAMLRCQLNKGSAKTLTRDDFVRAAADKEFTFNEKKKTRLGFYEE